MRKNRKGKRERRVQVKEENERRVHLQEIQCGRGRESVKKRRFLKSESALHNKFSCLDLIVWIEAFQP